MARCEQCGKVAFPRQIEGLCSSCYFEKATQARADALSQDEKARSEQADRTASVILTTETCHNLPVRDRLGIVTSECVIGMHLFADIATSLRDTFGGRSETMQKSLRSARKFALDELRAEAYGLGADAVVGIDLDYSEISGGGKSMLFLVASGTAVKLHVEAGDL